MIALGLRVRSAARAAAATGNGGSGGTVTDPCTGGLCDAADVKIDCDAALATCKADPDDNIGLTDAECDAQVTDLYCNIGAPGTGGTNGGGGAGGASGVNGCDEGLCLTNADRKAACEEFMPDCIAFCASDGEACGEDECIGFALVFICSEQEG